MDRVVNPKKSLFLKKEVFISHGKDLKPLNELKNMLMEFGLTPVVLSEQPSGGKTVMEKLEAYSDVGYAFVILTPDDLGGVVELGSMWSRPKRLRDFLKTAHTRPQQNVILEFGYFVGKLGRDRVSCLLKKPVEQPSDMQGIAYLSFKESLEEIRPDILKELNAAGYEIIDDLGKTRAFKASLVTITAQPAQPAFEALPRRVTTGYPELDRLMFGGIPEEYAIVLAAPSCDERQLLIRLFLEAGAKAGKTTLYITCEASSIKDLAVQFQSNFSLVLCNLQADLIVENLPNVYKLKGIDNLTDIDIALNNFFRTLHSSQTAPKRACVDLLSDVLLQHHAVIARRWLSSLLLNLKSKEFTTLAVIDPRMHPSEEAQAILGLFDGEITIAEKESDKGFKKVLKILKLYNQEYQEDELTLTREGLKSKP